MTSPAVNLLHSFLSFFTSSTSGTGPRRVDPLEAARLVRERKALLVDVREPEEWADGVAQDARLLPFSDLTGARNLWKPVLDGAGDRELILYCHSGARSGTAARILAAEGFKVANAGALRAWRNAGLPVGQPRSGR
jgi:rhodanese-related sulfurtransferase